MNIQEAFDILDIEETATKLQIKEKHRSLIKDFHSDKKNGNHEKSTLINNARDIALKYIDEKVNITLIKQVMDVVSFDNNKNIQQAEYKAQSDSIYTKISRKFVSRYKSYKSIAKTFGLISGIVALLTSKFIPIIPEVSKDPNNTLPFTFFAVMSGIIYLFVNSTAERIQDSIDDLKDTLSDKASYYEILNEILQLQSEKTKDISRHELEELCEEWFHNGLNKHSNKNSIDRTFIEILFLTDNSFKSTIRRIGIHDFVRFLISKGLEKNIIAEKEYLNSGITEIKYKIVQKAST